MQKMDSKYEIIKKNSVGLLWQKVHVVLGLVFLKYVSDSFEGKY